ncbi:MAG: hypothetical protein K0R54_4360 [Clostridiaceae bacterium]|nr:hypothetical protein [Clostridiaceae bacterium]
MVTPHIVKDQKLHKYRLACACGSTNTRIECIDKVGPENIPLYEIMCQEYCNPKGIKNPVCSLGQIEEFAIIASNNNDELLHDILFDVVSYFNSLPSDDKNLSNILLKMLSNIEKYY